MTPGVSHTPINNTGVTGMKTFIVFKTHVDIGFTDLSENVLHQYTHSMLPAAVEVCEQTQALGENKQYVWTMPSYMLKRCLDANHAPPEMLARAQALTASGQLAWHALPFTTHTEFFGLEEYIRTLMISRKLSESYGAWPIAAKMTDVPGHTRMLPSILAKAGVKFLHLGSNPSVMAPQVPRLFWWQGPDGGRVLTFYSLGHYGSSLTPPADWPYPVWLALMQTNDNLGPHDAAYVKALFEKLDETSPDVEATIGTLDDFYNELVKYPLDIPVITKDLADTWIHGTGSYPAETAALRQLRGDMTETEKSVSMGAALGLVNDAALASAQQALADAYEQCALFGEHTWGINVSSLLSFERHYEKKAFQKQKAARWEFQKAEQSWDEQRNRYASAAHLTAEAAGAWAASPQDGTKMLAFNGLGWPRDGLPAFGYRVRGKDEVKPAPTGMLTCDADAGLLENQWFVLHVDRATGGIASLFDKRRNKEWVNAGAPDAFGGYHYDIYGDDDVTEFMRAYTYRFFEWSVNDLGRMYYPAQPHLTFKPENFSLSAQTDANSATLMLKSGFDGPSVEAYGNARGIVTRITLYADEPVIDMSFELNGKDETPFIEAGHFVFPVKLEGARAEVNKLGDVLDIAADIQKGANNALHCIENFIDITNGNSGMAFVPRHTHLVSLGKKRLLTYTPTCEETEPTVFFNAFNNTYGTNFPQWMGGDYRCEFRLIPHDGNWQQGDVYRQALDYRLPVLEMPAPAGAPASCAWFDDLDGMAVLALKPAEQGDGFILRLHDITGCKRQTALTFPAQFAAVFRCDLQERILDEVQGQTLSFETQPFEVHSFYLKQ